MRFRCARAQNARSKRTLLESARERVTDPNAIFARDGKLQTTSCHYIVAFSISQHSLQGELSERPGCRWADK